MFQVGNGHFIAKMICIARIQRVNTGAKCLYCSSQHREKKISRLHSCCRYIIYNNNDTIIKTIHP